MQLQHLTKLQVTSAYNCVETVIGKLSFYSEEARTSEIAKFHPDKMWYFVNDEERCNLVYVDNGTVVGFLFGVVDAGALFVIWMGMDERYRSTGQMTTMWNRMEEWARSHDIHKVWMDCNQLNIPCIKFAEKMGMRKIGELTNFWYHHDYFLWEKSI